MQLELIHQAIISLCQPDMLQIGGVLMEPIFPSHLSQYKTEGNDTDHSLSIKKRSKTS